MNDFEGEGEGGGMGGTTRFGQQIEKGMPIFDQNLKVYFWSKFCEKIHVIVFNILVKYSKTYFKHVKQ